ncbi:MAG: hypothetical protein ACRD2H_10765 [Terriglobales bacterium]
MLRFFVAAVLLQAAIAAAPPAGAVNSGGSAAFLAALPARLAVPRHGPRRVLLASYGAMFVAKGVELPPTVLFTSAEQCAAWQARVPQRSARLNGVVIELQPAAMTALLAAESDARARGWRIVPTGADASRRDYASTLRLWRSRVNPGLRYWVARGKLAASRAEEISNLPAAEQLGPILDLERQGIFFSLDRRKPILESVAAPGSSQHLAMLALDVRGSGQAGLRAVLARHGWYQTVATDTPHFTYLGVTEVELERLGLRAERRAGRTYWLPVVPPGAELAARAVALH